MLDRIRAVVGLMWVSLFIPLVVAAAEGDAESTRMSLSDFIRAGFETGGTVMWLIAGLSFLAVFLILFFLLTIRPGTLYPKGFMQAAVDAAEEGDVEALRVVCGESDSPAARIISAAAEVILGDPRVNYMVIRDAVEDEGARQAGILWQRIQYLMDVAVVAPMFGLLGTVIGMIESFSGLEAGVSIVNKADALASGVSKAMYTTAAGLFVGIGAMVFYAFFRGRVNRLIGGLESACNRVLRRFLGGRKGPAGTF